MTKVEDLLASSSKALNINGASVNVTFSYSPSSGSVRVYALTCVFQDDGSTDLNKFGTLAALSNGLLIKATISGDDQQISVIKDNADMITRFSKNHFGSSAVLSILGISTPQGFGSSNDVFVGRFEFDHPLILTDSDSISITVRDNLSTIGTFNVACVIGIE